MGPARTNLKQQRQQKHLVTHKYGQAAGGRRDLGKSRRLQIKSTAAAAAAVVVITSVCVSRVKGKNKLPKARKRNGASAHQQASSINNKHHGGRGAERAHGGSATGPCSPIFFSRARSPLGGAAEGEHAPLKTNKQSIQTGARTLVCVCARHHNVQHLYETRGESAACSRAEERRGPTTATAARRATRAGRPLRSARRCGGFGTRAQNRPKLPLSLSRVISS